MELSIIWRAIIAYMLGGVIFSLILEASMDAVGMKDDATLINRITIFILWPFAFLVYIVSFVMAFFKND